VHLDSLCAPCVSSVYPSCVSPVCPLCPPVPGACSVCICSVALIPERQTAPRVRAKECCLREYLSASTKRTSGTWGHTTVSTTNHGHHTQYAVPEAQHNPPIGVETAQPLGIPLAHTTQGSAESSKGQEAAAQGTGLSTFRGSSDLIRHDSTFTTSLSSQSFRSSLKIRKGSCCCLTLHIA
jgi:hypothetical protein